MIEPNERKHEQSTDYDYVGEILDGSGNYTINLTAMVFNWFFEGRDYNFNSAACVDEDGEEAEEGCERYLQVRYLGNHNLRTKCRFCLLIFSIIFVYKSRVHFSYCVCVCLCVRS